MKLISLGQWAKKYSIKWRNAINWANRGKLKTAKKQEIKVERWMVDSDESPKK